MGKPRCEALPTYHNDARAHHLQMIEKAGTIKPGEIIEVSRGKLVINLTQDTISAPQYDAKQADAQ